MKRERMIFYVLTISIFACFLVSTTATAAEWKFYFENSQHSKFYIDTNSRVSLPGNKVRAWEKMQNTKGDKGTLSLLEIDCTQRMYTLRAMEPIDKNDIDLLKAFKENMRGWSEPDQEWEYIGTSDLDEAKYQTWCRENSSQKGLTKDK